MNYSNQPQKSATERTVWEQWEVQEQRRIKKLNQQQAYIELNNSYLDIERGTIKLNVFHSNNLRCLATQAYDRDDPMIDWWLEEFLKLPNWNEF